MGKERGRGRFIRFLAQRDLQSRVKDNRATIPPGFPGSFQRRLLPSLSPTSDAVRLSSAITPAPAERVNESVSRPFIYRMRDSYLEYPWLP